MIKGHIRWLLRVIASNSCIAVTVPLFRWSFSPHVTLHWLAQQYLVSLIYANCIGLLLAALTPGVWKRSERWPALVRWASRAALLLGATWIGCALGGAISVSIFRGWEFWSELSASFKIALPISFVALGFSMLYETSKARLEAAAVQLKVKELERQRALTLATQAKLSSLESRIHPHFLFNALNSVAALIHDDPDHAERLLNQLAALLRFSLDSVKARLVPLDQELKIVRDYLEIEKARFAGRLRYEIDAPVALLATLVPPLSIQTLIENSVKYAVAPNRDGGAIWVRVARDGEQVNVSVIDDGPGFGSQDLTSGHGLDNLQERLAALFADSAKLSISEEHGRTTVSISLPFGVRAAESSPALQPAAAMGPSSCGKLR
jgi:two-component system, LytTR family, sensor histidine kinase AlgZ